ILVRERRTEERHDPITHDLVDSAFVAMDRVHHQFEHRVENLSRLFGITVGEQFHRALQIGEQNGDLLALAFQRALRGQNLLGEVLRCICLGGCKSLGDVVSRRRQRLAAPSAEVVVRSSAGGAVWACSRELGPALRAECGVSWRFPLAARTLHPTSNAPGRSRTWAEASRHRWPWSRRSSPARPLIRLPSVRLNRRQAAGALASTPSKNSLAEGHYLGAHSG